MRKISQQRKQRPYRGSVGQGIEPLRYSKQCGQRYKDINYNNVTSITMSKQKNAFLNKKQDKSDDRIQGAKNFKDFIMR